MLEARIKKVMVDSYHVTWTVSLCNEGCCIEVSREFKSIQAAIRFAMRIPGADIII